MRSTIARYAALLLAVLSLLAHPGAAQPYPSKPIRIIVPFVAGGSMDRLARLLGSLIHDDWGQPVIVENRPGSGTVVGTELAAASAPDGYTLLMVANSAAVNSSLRPNLRYELLRDFVPVCLIGRTPHVFVVPAASQVAGLSELVAYARIHPGKLNYASIGPGSVQHLSGEMFKSMAGIDIVHVPYAGTAPAVTAMLAGDVDMMFANVADVQQHVRAGRLRALAVASLRRETGLENVPTFGEAGFPGFESNTWYGMLAPAGTPSEVVARINAEVLRLLELPKVRETLSTEGLQIVGSSPEAFRAFLTQEVGKYRRIVQDANLKAD